MGVWGQGSEGLSGPSGAAFRLHNLAVGGLSGVGIHERTTDTLLLAGPDEALKGGAPNVPMKRQNSIRSNDPTPNVPTVYTATDSSRSSRSSSFIR